MTSVVPCRCLSAEATGQTAPRTFQSSGVVGLRELTGEHHPQAPQSG